MGKVRKANPADAEAIAKVHVDSWRETYPGLMPQEILDDLSYQQREVYWRRTIEGAEEREFVYLAEDDSGELLGFVSGGPDRESGLPYEGEIYAIYLLRRYQRHGWGRLLFQAASDHLLQSGINSMILWVHRDNDSRGFYEEMGGKLVDVKSVDFGESQLALVAYGWPDLNPLPRGTEGA